MKRNAYDMESGLVYTEQVISAKAKSCSCSEPMRCGLAAIKAAAPREPRTLQTMVVRRLLLNLDGLDEDSLRSMPALLIEELWRQICAFELDDLRTWQIFARTHLGNGTFVHNADRTLPTCVQHDTFAALITRVNSSSMSWLTHLTIGDSRGWPIDLTHVADLRNLRSLHLRGVGGSLDNANDHTMHSWAEAATVNGAFRRLEMIFIEGHNGITFESLYHLSAFPALHTFYVLNHSMTRKRYDSTYDKILKQTGWLGPADGLSTQSTKRLWQRMQRPQDDFLSAYMKHRRSIVATGNDYPLLTLTYGRAHRRNFHLMAYNAWCFERGKGSTVVTLKQNNAPVIANMQRSATSAKECKLKAGKAKSVDAVLRDL